jgi:hypothetical protein
MLQSVKKNIYIHTYRYELCEDWISTTEKASTATNMRAAQASN